MDDALDLERIVELIDKLNSLSSDYAITGQDAAFLYTPDIIPSFFTLPIEVLCVAETNMQDIRRIDKNDLPLSMQGFYDSMLKERRTIAFNGVNVNLVAPEFLVAQSYCSNEYHGRVARRLISFFDIDIEKVRILTKGFPNANEIHRRIYEASYELTR